MPFPDTPCTFRGGCNCRAVRYRVDIPASSSRPLNPYNAPGAQPLNADHNPSPLQYTHLPMVAICHCNDCRRANAHLFGFGVVTILNWVSLLLLPQSTPAVSSLSTPPIVSTLSTRDASDLERSTSTQTPWTHAPELFNNTTGPIEAHPAIAQSYLRFYSAKPGRARGFCARCGTPLMYFAFGSPEGFPAGWVPQLDLWAGAVDRCDLEGEGNWFVPDRQLWGDFGLKWAMKFAGHERELGVLPRFGTHK